ncbi:MAG: hypothetical protein GY934_06845 [Gammaproteobacteria bacterium]|nr:hypothetical protein [Gammaproteobacteria bacterium]
MKKRQTTPDHWQRHFATQLSSGLSVTEYCRRESIRSNQWYYWQKRLRDKPVPSVSLVPVTVSPEPTTSRDCRIHLPNGIVLEFAGGYEPVKLAGELLRLRQG